MVNAFKKFIFSLCCCLLTLNLFACRDVSLNTVTTDGIDPSPNPTSPYEYHRIHSRDGIGKFYLGREIAKIMGHTEMMWLERPSRQTQERPNQAIEALDLQPTDTVADIGAGTGYFSFRIAARIPEGTVFAVDIQPEMVDVLEFLKTENQVKNLEPILGTPKDPQLPEGSIDLALMVDAYHEFEYPQELMEHLFQALKPGGRVVLLEYRRENPLIPIKTLHKMTQQQAKREMAAVGLTWRETLNDLPNQHFMVFERPKQPI
ncbi:MAG: class I SAM-dependent methyltransferase [Cyanobacteria bacterium SID2]|nr:class I SAM-dependent methyltransferase [Cyanobacteria bacterium SID2]MBP0002836.1 class I SAM-dependent methyltransferase [Cyanobacteria bacterium SBC]